MDVIAVEQVFKDSIKNKTGFDNGGLMELLFLGAVNPELLLQSMNHFKEKGHPSYQEIALVASYEPIVEFDPEPEGEECDNTTKRNTEHSRNDKKSGSSPNDQVIAFKIKTLILIS